MSVEQCQVQLLDATARFYQLLHELLDRQGVFQVMQSCLPNNPQEFVHVHEQLLHTHASFAEAHHNVIQASIAFARAQDRATTVTFVPETPLPEPPAIIRMTSVDPRTPMKRRVVRELFPALSCSESLEESSDE
jgi:hypothetical protein